MGTSLLSALDPFAPFATGFMQRPLVLLMILAVGAGTVGMLVNLRKLEFATDGLTHAVFPGLVLGFMVAAEPGLLPGAIAAAVVAAIALALAGRRRTSDETLIAIVLTTFFSVGIVLVSMRRDYSGQLTEMLFGRLLSVTDAQVASSGAIVAVAVAMVAITWRAQVFRAFDPAGARSSGLRLARLDIVANLAIALFVVAAAAAIGVLLVIAILIVPAATARLVARTIGTAILAAMAVAALTAWFGLLATWQLSIEYNTAVAPGATVALTMVAAYLVALAGYGIRRLVAGMRER